MRHSSRTFKVTPCQCPTTSERVYATRQYLERGEARVCVSWQCSQQHECTTVRGTLGGGLQMGLCPLSPWSKMDSSTDNQTAHNPHKT
jgi:hypothetical protein